MKLIRYSLDWIAALFLSTFRTYPRFQTETSCFQTLLRKDRFVIFYFVHLLHYAQFIKFCSCFLGTAVTSWLLKAPNFFTIVRYWIGTGTDFELLFELSWFISLISRFHLTFIWCRILFSEVIALSNLSRFSVFDFITKEL
jgi:hypothetical protein